MSTRVNPFATLNEPPVFTPKSKPEKLVPKETIARIAEENNFPSRQAPKPSERFYKAVDTRNVPSGELLRLALDALERAGGSS